MNPNARMATAQMPVQPRRLRVRRGGGEPRDQSEDRRRGLLDVSYQRHSMRWNASASLKPASLPTSAMRLRTRLRTSLKG